MVLKNIFKQLFNFQGFILITEISFFFLSHILIIKYLTAISAISGLFIGYLFLVIGHEIGGHRYFSHRSFQCHKFFEVFFHIILSVSNYGSALSWLVLHKLHHQNTDHEKDPTSPMKLGAFLTFSNIWKIRFFLFEKKLHKSAIQKIIRNEVKLNDLQRWHNLFPFMTILYFMILSQFGMTALITLFCIPSLFVSYVLNSINYFAHSRIDNSPLNTTWLNILTLGGGWHLNHHTSPKDFQFHKNLDYVGKIISTISK